MGVTAIDWDWTIYLKDILHLGAQALLVPVMIALVLLLVYAVFSLGSLLVEYLTERRRFTVNIPSFIDGINDAQPQELSAVIEKSGLLSDQKLILMTVARSIGLPKEDLFALAKAELTGERDIYDKVTGRNDTVVRVAPMFGLLATLIPLGPGIVAMGGGNVDELASSLLIAFDGTAAGLVVSIVFLLIARFRKRWYARYMLALETGMRCILQKAENVTPAELIAAGIDGRVHVAQQRKKQAQTHAVGATWQRKPQGDPVLPPASSSASQPASSPASPPVPGAPGEGGHHGV